MYRFERALSAMRGIDVQELDAKELLHTPGW
jgi:hypothetical protein